MYAKIRYWVQQYGGGERSDQRAVEDFMECEAQESISSLRNDLIRLAQDTPDNSALDQIVGVKRKVLYNSYQEWAKMMLLWMASYKR